MIATIILLLFMTIPFSMKRFGITCIVENEKGGIFIVLLSKCIWWTFFMLLANIWVPQAYFAYLWIVLLIGLSFQLYKEKKYFLFHREKKS